MQTLFLKFLALNYLFAYASLYWQLMGLYGKEGILPIAEVMDGLKKGGRRLSFWQLPTLFWWRADDCFLKSVAGGGVIGAVLALFGVFPAPIFLFLWLGYLSFVTVGQDFLSFQWDALLLEVGFIGIFYAIQSPPPPLLTGALWLLLFRFMFASGYLKLAAGSSDWRDLTAMAVHYETQPLPTRLAYYLHQLPLNFAKLSSLGVYFFELAVPFLYFGPPEWRLWGALLTIAFQVAIILTGNYAFFNTLTIALCIPLLDDRYLTWFPDGLWGVFSEGYPVIFYLLSAVGALLLGFNALMLMGLFIALPWNRLFRAIRPLLLFNAYGLFVNMTQKRDEILVEGSQDGENWQPYQFRWKPQNLTAYPKQVAPHQPRLDWQMWFAALSHHTRKFWFQRFLLGLLRGSPAVLALLAHNPFPNAPPKYVRSLLFRYHFTDLKTKRQTGAWWQREYLGLYSPPMRLDLGYPPLDDGKASAD